LVAQSSNETQYFLLSSSSVAPVVGEYTISGRRWIVHDQGALNTYGTQICQNLATLPR